MLEITAPPPPASTASLDTDTLILGSEDASHEVGVDSQSTHAMMAEPVLPKTDSQLEPYEPELTDRLPDSQQFADSQPVAPDEDLDSQPAASEGLHSQPLGVPTEVVSESQPSAPAVTCSAAPPGSQPITPEVSKQDAPADPGHAVKCEDVEPKVEHPQQPNGGQSNMGPPPPPEPKSAVAEALKRVNTVDIDQGKTPSPPQSLLAAASPNTSTVVLLNIAGVHQPVTVPLSPEQCHLAGLTLANAVASDHTPPAEPAPSVPAPGPPAPQVLQCAEAEAELEADPENDGMSSKQMLKNMYMRFSRSQKRYLKAKNLCLCEYVWFGCTC